MHISPPDSAFRILPNDTEGCKDFPLLSILMTKGPSWQRKPPVKQGLQNQVPKRVPATPLGRLAMTGIRNFLTLPDDSRSGNGFRP
jgi:hypothetical protein